MDSAVWRDHAGAGRGRHNAETVRADQQARGSGSCPVDHQRHLPGLSAADGDVGGGLPCHGNLGCRPDSGALPVVCRICPQTRNHR